jgi:hypothetical protein
MVIDIPDDELATEILVCEEAAPKYQPRKLE